ncbi:MAG: Trk family potassium uptake protein [Chloroflexi bacterium]|nr:Trk family potassium uptake protein [Chloroflexota bacterium]
MNPDPRRRLHDTIVRLPRAEELRPRELGEPAERRPRQLFTPQFILLYGFIGLIAVGSVLLYLPISDAAGRDTSPVVALFTATSAVTVTGHTAVSTAQHWSYFGQAVIFVLMLVGGLGFMAAATFVLLLIGQKATSISHQLVLRETIGGDQLGDLRKIAVRIVTVVFIIYVLGAVILFPSIQEITGFGMMESMWQSLFLSVSSFNNAGFSILPEISDARSLAILDNQWVIQSAMAVLIIVGCIGWTVLVDINQRKRFSRLSLDTKLVLIGSVALWVLGFGVYLLASFLSVGNENDLSLLSRSGEAMFHSISGRTAGFIIADFGAAEDFTKLVFTFLMLIGGGSGSVAGGIKVNTLMVVVAAVVSSIRARPQTEAFGREIPQTQVFRALAIGALALAFIMITVPVLTITEAASLRSGEMHFLDLFFDTVSAFATNGSSTGIVPQLGTSGQLIFIGAMLLGRIGPLTLALALAPQEKFLYRFAQERVRIG